MQLYAGVAKADITPPLGTYVNGDFVSHYAQHIHDSLYARTLVIKNESITIAFVVVDICVLPKEFVDEVKVIIRQRTGIPPEHVMMSATHTHAAGSIASVYLCASDLQYTKKLPALIVASVEDALKNLQPAKIGFGSVNVPEHVRCRRYFMQPNYTPFNPITGKQDEVKTNPFGGEQMIDRPVAPTDPQVSFLAVQSMAGKWISVLANYSLHYVGDWPNGTISADYFGVFSQHLAGLLNADNEFVGMMSNGTSGDVNVWEFIRDTPSIYPTGDFKKSEYIGKDIAKKVADALRNVEWEKDPSVSVEYRELNIKLRKPSANELEQSRKLIAASSYEQMEINDAGLKSLYAREQVLLNELEDELPFPLQVFKLGTGIIITLGAEIFAETGLWLKANSPSKKTFVVGLANANCGYVPPAHELKRGGYETWRSRTSKFEAAAEETIRNRVLELIKFEV